MIAKLTGKIDELGIDFLVIDVGGVGYLVQASARTLSAIGSIGEITSIYTQMQVSENDMRLIGFASKEERDWYVLLTSVQGVGGKVGLALLSALEPAELQSAIAGGDSASVTRANGVGPKLASRIVNELQDKVGGLATSDGKGITSSSASGNHSGDAVGALTSLGFKPAEATRAVSSAYDELGSDATLDALIRRALKLAGK